MDRLELRQQGCPSRSRNKQRVGRIRGLWSTVITASARDRRKRKATLSFNDELLRCFYYIREAEIRKGLCEEES